MTLSDHDTRFMELALLEAEKAMTYDEVPVGSVIVKDHKVVSTAHNLRESRQRVTSHAEILAIEKANQVLSCWRLIDCTIYITLEPCIMCTGAIFQSRMERIVYAAKDLKSGALGGCCSLDSSFCHHHSLIISEGIYEEESRKMLQTFFKKKRQKQT